MTSDKIGRYEIVHEIARGGMAIVYLAKDSYMERLVAVKVKNHSLIQQNYFHGLLQR